MSRKTLPVSQVKPIAREKSQFDNLHPGQEEAVRYLVDGHDTLVIQPTGFGKSAIYQIAGLMISGATLVSECKVLGRCAAWKTSAPSNAGPLGFPESPHE